MRTFLLSIAALFLLAAPLPAVAQTDCEEARCAAQEAVNNCSCEDAKNHGAYVSCVSREMNKLERQDGIPTECKGKVTRCAARSTCGKDGAVTCHIPEYGICDTTTGLCFEGTSTLEDGSCAADTDCLVGTRCRTKRSDERCIEAGGEPGGSGSCCSSCVVEPAPEP